MYEWYKYKYKNINRGNIKPFDLSGQIKFCKVLDVINGQTVAIAMDFNKKIYKWHVRLDGYKTYVVSDIDKTFDTEKKQKVCKKAYQAKEYLKKIIDAEPNKIFKIKINGFDINGLLLGELYFAKNTISINQIMVSNKYGIKCNNLVTYLNH